LQVQGRAGDGLLDLPVSTLEAAWSGAAATPAPPPTAADQAASLPAVPTRTQRPRVLILHANGTNRDREAALACRLAGGDPEIVHVNQLRRGERDLLDYQMLVLPGGFSYGDDLGAGRLWALDLEQRLGAMIHRFVDEGRPVLGICNGFQALVKAGLLPGGNGGAARPLTLTHNASARFECRWVSLQPNPTGRSLFTVGLREPIYCPVAHGEGRLVAESGTTAARLQHEGLIALTYSADATVGPVPYPANPNGSLLDIAGISNAAGNVLGLMPHPEDHIFPWQHPQRHRGASGGRGLVLFANGLRHC
jgi:phosphoribosylformylglycinamidine synthase